MADRMACKMKHTDSADSVEQQQLVVDYCYSCSQSIRSCTMEDKLAYMMEHIDSVVVVERR